MKWQACPRTANCLQTGLLEAQRAAEWLGTQPLPANPVTPFDLFYTPDVGTGYQVRNGVCC